MNAILLNYKKIYVLKISRKTLVTIITQFNNNPTS